MINETSIYNIWLMKLLFIIFLIFWHVHTFNFVWENITKVGPRIGIGFIHKVNFHIRLSHGNIVHCNTWKIILAIREDLSLWFVHCVFSACGSWILDDESIIRMDQMGECWLRFNIWIYIKIIMYKIKDNIT